MSYYIARRLLASVLTLIALALTVFLLIYLVPGDPAAMILGQDATPEAIAALRAELGLTDPWWQQLARWFLATVRGDLGRSYFLHQPVAQAIAARLPVTVSLTALALAISMLVGIPSGVTSAVRRGSWLDVLLMGGVLLGLSVPSFWLALNLIFLFSVGLRWFPTEGYVPLTQDPWLWLRHLALPALSLGLIQAAMVARMTRTSLLEVLGRDYVRTARAKGLSERVVVYRHALRNALIPVITVVGIGVGVLLGGAVVVETVFSLPGVGRLVVDAIKRRDYPVVQGAILVVAVMYLVVNLVVDLLYAWANPRIRYS